MRFSQSFKLKARFFRAIIIFACLAMLACGTAPIKDQKSINGFIMQMASKHQFDEKSLSDLFDEVEIKDDIIRKISKPSESLPWYKYRKIFLKKPRIEAGVDFWQKHEKTLTAVEKATGVPPEMIVAIIGVETYYGRHTGDYRVIDALSTLAFAYPPRSQFFRSELENFLILCRNENIDPLSPTGSYAGAMGIPQFMPSSYLSYTIDFNNDNYRDIWHDPNDAIASIGNYFAKHGWQKGLPVAIKIRDESKQSLNPFFFLKEDLRLIKSNGTNPNISTPLLSTNKAKIIAFKQENGEELWATSDNFFVITRYNQSPLYAMAAYQLSLAITNLKSISSFSSPYEKDRPTFTFDPGNKRVFK